MSVPSSMRPRVSSVTCAWIGSGRRSRALANARDLRFDLEDVLAGLDEQQIDAALDQSLRLLVERRDQLGHT